jgi:hypothetical protein
VDRSELEFIPAKQKESLFEDAGTKRVCAYCRVSTDDANQTSSYELQKNHYEDMIKEHPGWILEGIYADEGISGTSLTHRDEFNRMIRDCKDGKIDLIVTKSVSRFARNIVDCIAKVRELAELNPQVGVFFETEADTVKLCYYLFLNGFPISEIARILMELGRKTKLGNSRWTRESVVNVLKNERHCGEVLARKTYTPNYLDHKSKKNDHDRNQYRHINHHEAIVSREIFYATQKLLEEGKNRKGEHQLPVLQVVDRGVLKGFVPVNRTWTVFSDEDYRKASMSAYEDVEIASPSAKKVKRETRFDLSGYEIVRGQFFSTRLDPALTIHNGKLVFNTACMKKFENVEYVEVLFNSVEKCIAVRPCEKENPNAFRWGTLRDGRWAVLPKKCKGFANPLYHLLDWESNRKYRIRGQYQGNGDEQMIIFDLCEPEVSIKETVVEKVIDSGMRDNVVSTAEAMEEHPGEVSGKPVIIRYYPRKWASSFGRKTDEILFLERVKCYDDWDILRPAKTVESTEIISQEVLDDLRKEAKALMERMMGSA